MQPTDDRPPSAAPDDRLGDDRSPGRLWRLALQARRQELVGPIDHIADLSGRLAEAAAEAGRGGFASDLAKVYAAAREARRRVGETLAAETPADPAFAEEARAALRHDLRNRLNVILGYAEDRLEAADDPPPPEAAADLDLIVRAGRTCLRNVDSILAPGGQDMPADGGDETALIRDVIDSAREPARPSREVGRVLIVDDDPLNREILRRRLEGVGHAVAEADSPTAALGRLAAEPFDLVLLDIILRAPESSEVRNGFDVLLRMKADDRLRDVPVILFSALNEPGLIARGIELGAEDYLTRPIDPLLLAARVESCLEKVRLRRKERDYLAEIDHERRRADELLHVLLPGRVIRLLKETNDIPPRRYDRVAVLFADICGFTPYCDARPPEDVIPLLAAVVNAWEDAAERHDVQKVKTIGDAFMAACGLFEEAENPVLACLRCGLDMVAGTVAIAPEWRLRVGVHYGEVVGGKVGRRQYLFDLWGDTVNTAARMESHGRPGAVTLSRAAWDQVAEFAHGEPVLIDVKGKGPQEVVRFERFRDNGG